MKAETTGPKTGGEDEGWVCHGGHVNPRFHFPTEVRAPQTAQKQAVPFTFSHRLSFQISILQEL